MRPDGKVLENGPAAEEASSEAEKKEPERKEPAYRFPAVAPETAEFQIKLPPSADAPEGFAGSLDQLLDGLRSGALALETLPLAPLVDQYLTFRGGLEPEEAGERISDFLPLAAALIHLKSRLLLPQQPDEKTARQKTGEEVLAEIRRQERRRRGPAGETEEPIQPEDGCPRLSLLDLMVLLRDVQGSLRAPLPAAEEGLSVRAAMRWIRRSLPANAALDAESYFAQCGTIRDRAAVFLAILELGRARAVECHQNQAFAPLWLCMVPDDRPAPPCGRLDASPAPSAIAPDRD